MNEILDSLKSPGWWLSVVVAGLGINYLSAYTKPWLDAVLSKTSTTWRSRSEASKRKRAELVARLLGDERRLLLYTNRFTELRVRGLSYQTLFFFIAAFNVYYQSRIPTAVFAVVGIVSLLFAIMFLDDLREELAMKLTLSQCQRFLDQNPNAQPPTSTPPASPGAPPPP